MFGKCIDNTYLAPSRLTSRIERKLIAEHCKLMVTTAPFNLVVQLRTYCSLALHPDRLPHRRNYPKVTEGNLSHLRSLLQMPTDVFRIPLHSLKFAHLR